MTAALPMSLSARQLDALAAELDALRDRVRADLGERDARYIRAIYKAVRYTEFAGRATLMTLGWLPPAWLLGTGLLGLSKILDNMELGHNVMHGQYDWMRDPALNGKTFEWDIVGTSDNWRYTHNYSHHTWTNVRGMDDDIGYGLLRLFPEQRWKPMYAAQPVYAILFALLFQWGVAIQNLELGKVAKGKKSKEQLKEEWRPLAQKIRRQLLKDYAVFPLLAGPNALPVLLGNLAANGIRNLWTFTIIFCGHFTTDAQIFPKDCVENESRGHWYWRQILGSSNLTGGKLFHILSGNLSHQIEHHLFPDIPSCRYADMAPEVKAICARYGIRYNQGSLWKQFGQVAGRIVKYALPERKAAKPSAIPA